MKKQKKRNKKYNKVEAVKAMLRGKLKDVFILTVNGQTATHSLVCNSLGDEKSIVQSDAKIISNGAFQWVINIGVYGVLKDGRVHLETHTIKTKHSYQQRDLRDVIADTVVAAVDGFQFPNNIKDYGFIASPAGVDVSEERLFDIFEKNGAFR